MRKLGVYGTIGIIFVAVVVLAAAQMNQGRYVEHGGWRYTDRGILSYAGTPIGDELVIRRVRLLTPLGTFVPNADSKWFRKGHLIPLPSLDTEWVNHLVRSVPFTEPMNSNGFYRTDRLLGPNNEWYDMQLKDTPFDWVYAFKPDGGGNGVWISPARLNEFDWSSL